MAENKIDETVSDAWPECKPGQVRVLLLGTYHMDNPGLDTVNVDADDVLTERRQDELTDLVACLVKWEPQRVAVERPYDRSDEVNALYREYRAGVRSYEREEEIEPPHPYRDELHTECRSEVVQIGFRLAEVLDHEQVYPIDYPVWLANEDAEALEERGVEPDAKTQVTVTDLEAFEREQNERLADSTIPEYLRWMNREEHLRVNHEGMFHRFIPWGEGDNFGGPRLLATWYDRNIRMVHNLWRAMEPGDERMVLVVGSGHVRVLRHLLTESPMFCPVSPRPYL
ncbi:DUF5694 domain-containing protein [Halomarina pelagica]|uniref:DUF5694 domain-containing protein n=1 Tax=Halomarina pelagica TaxID=2961599 RepID=UPI0020C2D965|nr:DUF5694 domain-containing protein [Halomarina sp. BND7]